MEFHKEDPFLEEKGYNYNLSSEVAVSNLDPLRAQIGQNFPSHFWMEDQRADSKADSKADVLTSGDDSITQNFDSLIGNEYIAAAHHIDGSGQGQKQPNECYSGPLSKFVNMLESIPSLPASASEYPRVKKSLNKQTSFGSIHVRTANNHVTSVTVTCACSKELKHNTDDGIKVCACSPDVACKCASNVTCEVVKGALMSNASNKEDVSITPSSSAGKRGASSNRSAFLFIFFLGAISAMVWVFLLGVSFRLGRYIYRLVL
eukprot:TRINITY_DN4923_c0_g1_i1.p1 TRINITY_DN4923_c0_g1~~TRINITY_DN4923_c0_g1_i1.p1  ORF type:complete len:285 (-),score=61.98 TRINITY_DN4923_c0_g1_i1:253-1035(-)